VTSRVQLLVGAAQRASSPRSDSIWFCRSSRLRRSWRFRRWRGAVLGLPIGQLPLRLDALAQLEDGAARLVVLEQRGMAGQRRQQGGAQAAASGCAWPHR
jgi:hypothetical protein